MKSAVAKRSIVIAGHRTSVSLEQEFWEGLKMIAGEREVTLSKLVTSIDSDRQHVNLSSSLRLFVLNHYRRMLFGEGGVWRAASTRTEPHPRRTPEESEPDPVERGRHAKAIS